MKIYTYCITKEKVMLVSKYETLAFNRKKHNFVVMPICVVDFFGVNKFYKYYNSFLTTLQPLSKKKKLILMRKSNEIKKIKNKHQ